MTGRSRLAAVAVLAGGAALSTACDGVPTNSNWYLSAVRFGAAPTKSAAPVRYRPAARPTTLTTTAQSTGRAK